jgi:hypothetical protein
MVELEEAFASRRSPIRMVELEEAFASRVINKAKKFKNPENTFILPRIFKIDI